MRFMRIIAGYLAAAYCAGLPLFLTVAAEGSNRSWGELILLTPFFITFGMVISVPATIFQSALFITISERFGIRTLPYYLCAGFLTGLAATVIVPISQSAPILREDWYFYLGFAAVGAACGAIYWGFAGFLTGLAATLILPVSQSAPLLKEDWYLLKEDWYFYLSFAAAGAVCGAIYWGIAGRKAGLPAQTAGQRMSYIRCLLAGSLFSAIPTGAGLLILPNLLNETEAGTVILCFLVYAALGAYFICAFMQREAAAAAA